MEITDEQAVERMGYEQERMSRHTRDVRIQTEYFREILRDSKGQIVIWRAEHDHIKRQTENAFNNAKRVKEHCREDTLLNRSDYSQSMP
jgi:hypothetical protein